MDNEHAIEIMKAYRDRLTSSCSNQLDSDIEAFNLAIKALEVVDDVNHTVYRNENCKKAGRCYDYVGYNCAGCNGEEE